MWPSWSCIFFSKLSPKIQWWTICFCRWGFGWVDKGQWSWPAGRIGDIRVWARVRVRAFPGSFHTNGLLDLFLSPSCCTLTSPRIPRSPVLTKILDMRRFAKWAFGSISHRKKDTKVFFLESIFRRTWFVSYTSTVVEADLWVLIRRFQDSQRPLCQNWKHCFGSKPLIRVSFAHQMFFLIELEDLIEIRRFKSGFDESLETLERSWLKPLAFECLTAGTRRQTCQRKKDTSYICFA